MTPIQKKLAVALMGSLSSGTIGWMSWISKKVVDQGESLARIEERITKVDLVVPGGMVPRRAHADLKPGNERQRSRASEGEG